MSNKTYPTDPEAGKFVRKSGFDWPFNVQQVTVWVFSCMTIATTVYIIKIEKSLPLWAKISTLFLYGVLLVGGLVLNHKATSRNTEDPVIELQR